MILAQNLLQRLSGNKSGLLILFCSFLIASSCSGPKEMSRTKTTTTSISKKRKKRAPETKVDTVKWTEVSKADHPPIEYEGGPRVEKKGSYNAVLMIPFQAKDYFGESYDDENERFIHFYSGIKLGLEKLSSENINLSLDVVDTESSEERLKSKLSKYQKGTHFIIGPYERDLVKIAAEHCKSREIPLVSPWQASSSIASENPYYIQLTPSLREHYDKMVSEVTKKYRADQVIILKNENGDDDGRVNYIQQRGQQVLSVKSGPFQEFAVNSDSLILSEFYFSELFDANNETVFIIQNYSYDDDDFIYNCIRKLSAVKGARDASVYGLPILLDTDKIDFGLHKLLDIKVIKSRFVDREDVRIKAFRKTFLEEYGTLPTDEAYYGYDVIMYFGRAINKYGTNFQFYLDQEKQELLETNFDIQKSFGQGRKVSDDFRDINYFVNKHLDVIQMEENKFRVKRR